MRSRPLELNCPVCGSSAITYTCEPHCCFNHVCGACGASFQTLTRALGERVSGVAPPEPPPDSCDPAAACRICGAVSACMIEDGRVACWKCGAVLAVLTTEVERR